MSTRTALVTCCDRYMGNAIKEKFEELGINVIAGPSLMHSEQEVNELLLTRVTSTFSLRILPNHR